MKTYNGTKKEASLKIAKLIQMKLSRHNDAVIGFYFHNHDSVVVDYGFTCQNNTPDIILFDQYDDLDSIGDYPEAEDWDDELLKSIAQDYENCWISDILQKQEVTIEFLKQSIKKECIRI